MKRFNEGWDFASGEIEQARGMNSESAIADAIIKRAKEVESDRDPQTTYWVELGYDDKNTYACVMCWCDKDNAEYFGYEDEADFVLAKIAFCPDNSAMNEYDIDWLMPYDEDTGEVWDTELQISSSDWSDADWLAEEWLAIMDRINKSAGYEQLVDDDELTEGLSLNESIDNDISEPDIENEDKMKNWIREWEMYLQENCGDDAKNKFSEDIENLLFQYKDLIDEFGTISQISATLELVRNYTKKLKTSDANINEINKILDKANELANELSQRISEYGSKKISEGCHGGKKKKKKVLNQKKVCGEDAKRTKNGITFYIDDNAEPEIVRNGLVDYTLDGFIDKGDFDAPCKIGFYDGEDEPAYIFVSGGVTDDGYEFEKETIEL